MERSSLKFSDGTQEEYILCDYCGNQMYRKYNTLIGKYFWRCSNPECPES